MGGGAAPSRLEGRVGENHSAWMQVPLLAEVRPGTVERWPLRSSLELGAIPSVVSQARLHTRELLAEWGCQDSARAPNWWSRNW